jgi:hypothetical protein
MHIDILGGCSTDDRCDPAAIERVALQDEDWPAKAWSGPGRWRKIRPPHFSLRNYHSEFSSTRRPARATKGSC